MIKFQNLEFKVDFPEEERYLKEIEEMCDSIEIEETHHKNWSFAYNFNNATEYRVKVTKGSLVIKFYLFIKKKQLHATRFFNFSTEYNKHNQFIFVLKCLRHLENKEIQEHLDTIICKDNICPICESELKIDEFRSLMGKECANKCYFVSLDRNSIFPTGFGTFDENAILDNSDESVEKIIRNMYRIRKSINYWRENDRYLAKILKGRSNEDD
ncbi:gp463 [Bacillus phage G]|uniref:Gp463 n=1 Tax=Bacillus phage G TaxID=2884420 RepID=G3MAK4_9CAUD|nr:gp463 [Bacillus phage G]AEO93721.1 gp463 [Bacillus phage G]